MKGLLTSAVFGEMIYAAMRLKSIKTLKSVIMTADEEMMLRLTALILLNFEREKEGVKVRKKMEGTKRVDGRKEK